MIEPIEFENTLKIIKIGRGQSVHDNIVFYGDDNLYPNTMESLIAGYRDWETDRKSTRLNSSHSAKSRMPSSA